MKKIIMSLAMIAAVSAMAYGITTAYFTDTETSTGNTFTAGTIDIAIDDSNPFTDHFDIGDLKPGEVGYINFKITNEGMNPVDVSKRLYNFTHTDSGEGYLCKGMDGDSKTSSEPECVAEQINSHTRIDNVETQILYDLSVEVYNSSNVKTWYQTIYAVDGDGDKNLYEVYGKDGLIYVALGMIPVNGYMLVTQSYHFNAEAGNEYQGDGLEFDMEILGEQLTGENGVATVVLENKTKVGNEWIINSADDIKGTLKYETNGPKFVYTVSGIAPNLDGNDDYVLAIGMKANGAGYDVDTFITNVTTGMDGSFDVSGSIDLNKDMMGVKAWLVPASDWGTGGMTWNSWPDISDFLWETSLIWYNDTEE